MGCCDADSDEEERARVAYVKGPVTERHCTDPICLIIFILYFVAFGGFMFFIIWNSDSRYLHYGRNTEGKVCGFDEFKDKPVAFFPDWNFNPANLIERKNIKAYCVEKCPEENQWAPKDVPKDEQVYVPNPLMNWFGRCVPWRKKITPFFEEDMCADPRCDHIDWKVDHAVADFGRKTCGPSISEIDADQWWFIDKPSDNFKLIWESLAAKPDNQVSTTAVKNFLTASDSWNTTNKMPCEVKIIFQSLNSVKDNSDALQKVLSWGFWMHQLSNLEEQKWRILGIGIGGAIALSMIIMLLYSFLVRVAFCILSIVIILAAVVLEYVLLAKAGWVTGNTGRKIVNGVQSIGLKDLVGSDKDPEYFKHDPDKTALYRILAVVDCILILLLILLVCWLWGKLKIIVALCHETAIALVEMCPLFLVPFVMCVFVIALAFAFLFCIVAVITFEWDSIGVKEDHQKWLLLVTSVSFLWIYYFLDGLRTMVICMGLASWYFERDSTDGVVTLKERCCCSVLCAIYESLRYHIGTVAFGSFIIAISKIPALIFEYIVHKFHLDDANTCCVCIVRCVLWMWEKCVQFITEYAYINTAVYSKPFCLAAGKAIRLMVEYPVQIAMNTLVLYALRLFAVVTVPLLLALVSWMLIKSNWMMCTAAIMFISYFITRTLLGVFEDAVHAMFVCAIRDDKEFGGKHSPASLRSAFGMHPKESHATFNDDPGSKEELHGKRGSRETELHKRKPSGG